MTSQLSGYFSASKSPEKENLKFKVGSDMTVITAALSTPENLASSTDRKKKNTSTSSEEEKRKRRGGAKRKRKTEK